MGTERSSTPPRRALRVGLAVVVTGGLAALIALAVPFGDVADALRSLDPFWLAPMLGVYGLTFLCRAARFRGLGVPLGIGALTGVTFVHQFLLRVLPLRTGELAFPVLVRRLAGRPVVEGLALIVLLHLLDLACLAVAFLAALLAVPRAREAIGPWGTAVVAAAIPAMLVAYALLPGFGERLARGLAVRWAGRRPGLAERLRRAAETLAAVRAVSRRTFLAATLWTALMWLGSYVFAWTALAAVGVDVGPAEVVVGSTAAALAAVLPIGGIGSFGTLEGGWAAGFVLVGVAAGPALASGLVLSGASFAFAGIGAGIAWGAFSRRSPPRGGR